MEFGVERSAEVEILESSDEFLPTPIGITAVSRVTDGYSLELSDGRTLFLAQTALDAALPASGR